MKTQYATQIQNFGTLIFDVGPRAQLVLTEFFPLKHCIVSAANT